MYYAGVANSCSSRVCRQLVVVHAKFIKKPLEERIAKRLRRKEFLKRRKEEAAFLSLTERPGYRYEVHEDGVWQEHRMKLKQRHAWRHQSSSYNGHSVLGNLSWNCDWFLKSCQNSPSSCRSRSCSPYRSSSTS
jgi:hypothetical protein